VQSDGTKITLVAPCPNAEVRYTVDGSDPGADSPLYRGPFELPKKAALSVRTFLPNGRSSRIVTLNATQ
jgi:hexosaminidase